MFIVGNNSLGGSGFVPTASKGYLRTATGYPLTLSKTLAKPLESIKIYGASGGVGDKTANLLNPTTDITASTKVTYDGYQWYKVMGYQGSGCWNYAESSSFKADVDFEAGKTYTVSLRLYTSASGSMGYVYVVGLGLLTDSGNSFTFTNYALKNVFRPYGTSSYDGIGSATFTPNEHISKMCLTCYASQKYVYVRNIQIEEASGRTTYEPYGYRVPVVFDDGTDTKTVKLYSDAQLTSGDLLTVTETEAIRTSNGVDIDVSAIQNRAQDMTMWEANGIGVTADTTVEPDGMKIQYWSSSRREEE